MAEPSSKRPLQLTVPDPAVVRGVIVRLRLTHLLGCFPERPIWALFIFVNGFTTSGILAEVTMASHTPFVFPSLGPNAILLFY